MGVKKEATYVKFTSFEDVSVTPNQEHDWYPWPYREAITVDEAWNELAMLTVGHFGKPIGTSNGAPIR